MERTRRSTRTERKHGCLVIFTIEATINSCSSSQKNSTKKQLFEHSQVSSFVYQTNLD